MSGTCEIAFTEARSELKSNKDYLTRTDCTSACIALAQAEATLKLANAMGRIADKLESDAFESLIGDV